MGINICVMTLAGDDHLAWDFCRQWHDRHFVDAVAGLPEVRAGEHGEFSRPTDFLAWRAAIGARTDWENVGRYIDLLDLLEADPSYWIYLSI